MNDAAEAEAITSTFAEATEVPLVSSSKAVIGHTMGAAGALEAIITCLALAKSTIPPTGNFITADPRCAINCVPNTPIEQRITVALSNSFAFGGTNVSLLFRALGEEGHARSAQI